MQSKFKARAAFSLFIFAGLVMLSFMFSVSAKSEERFEIATLVEAEEYSPCDCECAPFNHPTTAYCFRARDGFVVGERATLLGESNAASMRDSAGKEVPIRLDHSSISIRRINDTELQVRRGSFFEHFKDAGCIAVVHTQKLAVANRSKRPANIPADAFPLASMRSSGNGPVFRWFQCAMSSDSTAITCRKWDPHGEVAGVDRYCARTSQGALVMAEFDIDHLASREGRLILKSGAVLQRDDRGRINDELMRPGEACYQLGLNQ